MTKKQAAEVMAILYELHPNAACELDHRDPFQLLVATVLSAQTTDVAVNKVTPALFERYPTPYDLSLAEVGDVENLIRRIGLYKNKAKNIVALSKILVDTHDSQVPEDIKTLVTLPGVGQKTANVVVSNAFGVPAIAVDTHVFRVSNRIGIAKAKNVKETEAQLQKKIPKEEWIQAHHTFIFHGRYICDARKPACERCPLTSHCSYYKQTTKKSKKN